MGEIFSSLWKTLKKNMVGILLFELAYRTATVMIIIQCTQMAINFSLKQQGFSYLTEENFAAFLGHPISIGLEFLIILLILLFFLVEVSSLFVCYQHAYYGEKIFVSDMFYGGLQITWKFLKNSRWGWLFCVMLSAPYLSLFLLIREISYVKMLQYTATFIYKVFPSKELLFIVLSLLLLISAALVFTLPYCLLEDKKSLRGIAEGIRLLKRRFQTVAAGFAILNVCIVLITGLLYILANVLAVGYAAFAKSSATVISAVLVYGSWIDMGIGLVIGGVQLVISLAFVYVIYIKYKEHDQHRTLSVTSKVPLLKRYPWMNRIGRRKVAAVIALCIIAAEGIYVIQLASNSTKITENMISTTGITAHRGGALMAPENTISALSYSIEAACDYAEIDVQETKDGELILLHDNSLKRTAGLNEYVWNLTYQEIEKLDAGISFHKKYRGEKIPTLTEAIEFCKGRLDLNIEIKYNGNNKGIVKKVVQVIEENDFTGHCVITSMNYQFLKQVKEMNPDIRTGYIMNMTFGSISQIDYADFFSVKSSYINETFTEEAHSCGKEVHAWTVNYRGDVKELMNYGVDNIITDNPVLVRQVLNGKSDLDTGFWELLKYGLRL